MTGEEAVLAASIFLSALAVGLLGMLTAIMRPMLAAKNGPEFQSFMEEFLRYAGEGWGKAYNFTWSLGMTFGPAAAIVLLADDTGSTAFVLTATALALVVVGVLILSNAWKTPTYRRILSWDPKALPADWEDERRTYFLINVVQLLVTWSVFILLLVALISL